MSEEEKTRKKPEPIPLMKKLGPKLDALKSAARAICEDLAGDETVSMLSSMANETERYCSTLESSIIAHLPGDYIKPKKDHWAVPVGSTVTVKSELLERYNLSESFKGEVIIYGKHCRVRCLDDNSIIHIERAHLEVVSVPVTD